MAGAGALAVSTRTSKMAHPHNAFDARTVDQRGYTCPWAGLLATWWPVSERGWPRDCFKEEEVEDSNLLKNEPQSCHGIISAVFSELCSSRASPSSTAWKIRLRFLIGRVTKILRLSLVHYILQLVFGGTLIFPYLDPKLNHVSSR